VRLAESLDLGDDEAVRVLGRHRQRQVVEGERLALHGDVAGEVRRRAAQDRNRDRERLVEQPLLAVDRHDPNEILMRAPVDAAALLARVNERAQADLGERAGTMACNVAKELRQRSEREVVSLDAAFDRHRRELRHETPMSTDRPPDETCARQAIEAPRLAITRRRRKNQREITW